MSHHPFTKPAADPTSTSTTTYRIRLVPHLETYRSVHFEPVVRDLKPCDDSDNLTGRGTVVKIGRFTERAQQALDQAASGGSGGGGMVQSETVSANMGMGMGAASGGAWRGAGGGGDVTAPSSRDGAGADFGGTVARTNANVNANTNGNGSTGAGGGGPLSSNKVAFRSKVVSRAHAEFWVEAGGQVGRPARSKGVVGMVGRPCAALIRVGWWAGNSFTSGIRIRLRARF
jgi:hypothetical protein